MSKKISLAAAILAELATVTVWIELKRRGILKLYGTNSTTRIHCKFHQIKLNEE